MLFTLLKDSHFLRYHSHPQGAVTFSTMFCVLLFWGIYSICWSNMLSYGWKALYSAERSSLDKSYAVLLRNFCTYSSSWRSNIRNSNYDCSHLGDEIILKHFWRDFLRIYHFCISWESGSRCRVDMRLSYFVCGHEFWSRR